MKATDTKEYRDAQVNLFVDDFTMFGAVLAERTCACAPLAVSDKIALFSIYVSQRGQR